MNEHDDESLDRLLSGDFLTVCRRTSRPGSCIVSMRDLSHFAPSVRAPGRLGLERRPPG